MENFFISFFCKSCLIEKERDRKKVLKAIIEEINIRILYGHPSNSFCRCPDDSYPISDQLQSLDFVEKTNLWDDVYDQWLESVKSRRESQAIHDVETSDTIPIDVATSSDQEDKMEIELNDSIHDKNNSEDIVKPPKSGIDTNSKTKNRNEMKCQIQSPYKYTNISEAFEEIRDMNIEAANSQ
ncbi:hypothetical protein WA158_007678 [Blastocystis sp. Blastoise]